MKKTWPILLLTYGLTCAAEVAVAQNACYNPNYEKAEYQFSIGDYILARKYYQAAESCYDLPPNALKTISRKISVCDTRIKEQDQLKNRKLIAQSLHNLAKKAITEYNYLEALRFMRYANVYFPDNPAFLPTMTKLVYEAPFYVADTLSRKTVSLLPSRAVKLDTTPYSGLLQENVYFYETDVLFSPDSRFLLVQSNSGIRLVNLETQTDKLLLADPRIRRMGFVDNGNYIVLYNEPVSEYSYSEIGVWNTNGEQVWGLKDVRKVITFPYNDQIWAVREPGDTLVLFNCKGSRLTAFGFDTLIKEIYADRVTEERKVLVSTDTAWNLIRAVHGNWEMEKTPLPIDGRELISISDDLAHLVFSPLENEQEQYCEIFAISGKKTGEIEEEIWSTPRFLPDNQSIVLVSHVVDVVGVNGNIRIPPFAGYNQYMGTSAIPVPNKNQILIHFDYAADSGVYSWGGDFHNVTLLPLDDRDRNLPSLNAKQLIGLSPDGRYLLRTQGDWTSDRDFFSLYDLDRQVNRLVISQNGLGGFKISEDGRFLSSFGATGVVYIYDLDQAHFNRYGSLLDVQDAEVVLKTESKWGEDFPDSLIVFSGFPDRVKDISMDWEDKTPLMINKNFSLAKEFYGMDEVYMKLKPVLASGEPFLEFLEYGQEAFYLKNDLFWSQDEEEYSEGPTRGVYCLSVDKLLKATNHIYIPDFSPGDKLKYEIDRGIIPDHTYLPLPDPGRAIRAYDEQARRAAYFGKIARTAISGSEHQNIYRNYALNAYRELFKAGNVKNQDSISFLRLLAHFYPDKNTVSVMAGSFGISPDPEQLNEVFSAVNMVFPGEEDNPCGKISYTSWPAIRYINDTDLKNCIAYYQERAASSISDKELFLKYLTLSAEVSLLNNKIPQALEILETVHQIKTTNNSQILQAFLYLLTDRYSEALKLLDQQEEGQPDSWTRSMMLRHLKILAQSGITHPNLPKAYRYLKGAELDDFEKTLFRVN